MAFAFNAALIQEEIKEGENSKKKINKDTLNELLSVKEETNPKESNINVLDIHNNLKEENQEELHNFYNKEQKPRVYEKNNNDLDTISNNSDFMLLKNHSFDSPKDNLLQKVNHILQLLEEQKEIKTNQKNEEIVLYCFIGIFIIYVLDCFVNLGKYSR